MVQRFKAQDTKVGEAGHRWTVNSEFSNSYESKVTLNAELLP